MYVQTVRRNWLYTVSEKRLCKKRLCEGERTQTHNVNKPPFHLYVYYLYYVPLASCILVVPYYSHYAS